MEPAKRKSRAAVAQPAEILASPDALLNIQTVCMVTGFSKNTVYRFMNEGKFPDAIKLGSRTTRWRAAAVTKWLQECTEVIPEVAGQWRHPRER
jgi:prophage regulatory protein